MLAAGCRLLTLKDAADELGCSVSTVKRRVRDGDLPVFVDGRLVRVRDVDLQRYVAERLIQPGQARTGQAAHRAGSAKPGRLWE